MKQEYISGMIDSRKYDNIFLLSKILVATEQVNKLASKEKEILYKLFEKPRN